MLLRSCRVCREMGVTFLGSFALYPQLCKAAEQGKSYFEGDNKCFVSAPALKASTVSVYMRFWILQQLDPDSRQYTSKGLRSESLTRRKLVLLTKINVWIQKLIRDASMFFFVVLFVT